MMRFPVGFRFLFLLWLYTLLSAALALAQTFHVRAGASGLNNGTDWNNAFTTLPNLLQRGATYFVSSGNYGDYTFDDNGTATITVKKATVNAHGSSTGWQNSFANGQAVWSSWEFTRGYYTIDGITRNPDMRSGHGFKIQTDSPSPVIRMNQESVSYITIAHLEIQGLGRYIGDFQTQPSPSVDEGFYMFGNDHITIRNGYFHDIEGPAFKTGGNSYVTIEGSVIARNRTDPWFHGTAWGGQNDDFVVLRHNLWEDITGTAIISVLNRGSSTDVNQGWEIYGNVFSATPSFTAGCGDGAIAVINRQLAVDWKIYNNSFIKLGGLSSRISIGVNDAIGSSNVSIFNNFWWNSKTASYVLDGCTNCQSNFNRYDATNSGSESQSQINATATTTTFADYSNRNYRLSAPTTAGTTLSAPYNTDVDGKVRGADGVWDRGAYEYSSSNSLAPAAPIGLRIDP